ncbi:hypothetical protein ACROYT_G017279 [Oculina patagonica]
MAASGLFGALRHFSRVAMCPMRNLQKPSSVLMLTRHKSSSTQPNSAQNAKEANWKCRQDLATAFRGLHWYGLSEGVCTHLTMMAPAMSGEGEVMLMIPYGLHWSQATPSSLLGVNDQLQLVEGQGHMQTESVAIHKGVHDARPDAVCVFHLHSPYTTAIGMLEEEMFGMYHQTHCRFYNDFAYDLKYQGAAKSCDEGDRLAKLIGNKAVLFMSNHGVLFTASTAAIAFDNAYFMERACMLQMIAMQTGKKLRELPDDVSKLTYQQTQDDLDFYANAHFEGIKAVLLKKDSGFLDQ